MKPPIAAVAAPVDSVSVSADVRLLLQEPTTDVWQILLDSARPLWAADKKSDTYRRLATPEQRDVFEGLLFAWACQLSEALGSWPKELPRQCPQGWPANVRLILSHHVLENSTYGHYIAGICGDPRLQLGRGPTPFAQAVWLERRFTGGIVPASVASTVCALLRAAFAAQDWARVQNALRTLKGATQRTGATGTADLTGGISIYVKNSFLLEPRLEVEVKVGDGQQRPEQQVREQSVRRRGGCYVLCSTVESGVQQIVAYRDAVLAGLAV